MIIFDCLGVTDMSDSTLFFSLFLSVCQFVVSLSRRLLTFNLSFCVFSVIHNFQMSECVTFRFMFMFVFVVNEGQTNWCCLSSDRSIDKNFGKKVFRVYATIHFVNMSVCLFVILFHLTICEIKILSLGFSLKFCISSKRSDNLFLKVKFRTFNSMNMIISGEISLFRYFALLIHL